MFRVMCETEERIAALGLGRSAFLADASPQGRMNADGLFMCVFRIAEEAGNMSRETKAAYPDIPWNAIHGMRNIFAHDYGRLDRRLVWNTITDDFPTLKAFCRAYAEDHSVELTTTGSPTTEAHDGDD